MDDLISRQAAINALGDKPLAWTEGEYELGLQNQWQSDVDALKELPSAQPEQIARDIATIIENEHDMRVLLKNTERTEKHDLVSRRAAIETAKNVAYAVDEHGSAGGHQLDNRNCQKTA